MNAQATKLGQWLAHIVLSVFLASVLVFAFSTTLDSTNVYWPSLFGHLLVVGCTIIVATIVLHAENNGGEDDPEIATSLFTFANSISALAPLLTEVLLSVPPGGISERLSKSVIFALVQEQGAPELVTITISILLTLAAFVMAITAAHMISMRRSVAWYASFSSIVILTLETLLLSDWDSAPLGEAADHLLAVTLFLLLLIVIFAGFLGSVINGVPIAIRVSSSISRESVYPLFRAMGLVIRGFLIRVVQSALTLLLLLIPFAILTELLLPNVLGLYVLLTESDFFEGFGAALWGILTSTLKLSSLIIITAFALMLMAGVFSAARRLRVGYASLRKFVQLLVRLLVVFVMIVLFALLVFAAIIVVGKAGSTFLNWMDQEEEVEVVLDPQPPVTFTPTDGSSTQTGGVGITIPTSETPSTPENVARDFEVTEVDLLCDSGLLGFGWQHASSDELAMSIHACSTGDDARILNEGFLLVVGSSSTEASDEIEKENNRAGNRGFALGTLLRRRQNLSGDPSDVFVLNLGMYRHGAIGVPRQYQVSRDERPTRILKFMPLPSGSSFNSDQVEGALGKYISENFSSSDYTLCNLYLLPSDETSSARQNWSDWQPMRVDMCENQ